MSFAVPAALILSAIALPIIVLYILKVRLRRMQVSTNLFWKQVYEEKPPRSIWQNLRHLLSLLAQLLLLLLLVLAIADPYFSWQALQARRIVVVIDTSASMRATDVSPSRFEAARRAVHRTIDGLRFRDEMAIVSASNQPEVVLGMANHVPTLRRAIDSVEPVDASASMDSAIELARQLIGDHPHGQILLFSDGCAQRPAEIVTTSLAEVATNAEDEGNVAKRAVEANNLPQSEVFAQTFATTAANVGIVQFQARRSLIDPLGYEILVSVKNASDQPVKGRLELELEGIPVDVVPLNLKANELWSRSLEKTSLEGGELKASLTQLTLAEGPAGIDATSDSSATQKSDEKKSTDVTPKSSTLVNVLETDDVAWGIVPPRKVQNVLIVTPGNLFLRKVFEANPLVNISIAAEPPTQWPADTIVVLHRKLPTTLPNTPLLVIDPESDCDAWKLAGAIENPIVTEQDKNSPLMTHIRMDNVLLPEAKRIEFSLETKPLASTVTGESVYTELQRQQGKCLVLSVNLEKSDLAFRTAFPILITNALGWFAEQVSDLQPAISGGQLATFDPAKYQRSSRSDSNSSAVVEGKASELQSKSSSTNLDSVEHTLVDPSGKQSPLLSRQVGPLRQVGVWKVHSASEAGIAADNDQSQGPAVGPTVGPVVEHYAVNLANAQETDLRPMKTDGDGKASGMSSGWLSRPLWYYLAALACLFCVIEWFLYQRRFIT